MKKPLFTTVLLLGVLLLHAQSEGDRVFKPFKVDLSLGGAVPQGSGSKAGAVVALEPKYAINDQFWLGLRIETAIMARVYTNSDGSLSSANVSASGSYVLTGDYYFNTNSFRPFVGGGLGVYSVASVGLDNNGNTGSIAQATEFGGMIRAGFEAGHFRMGIEYNIIANSTAETTDFNGNTSTAISRNSYLGIKLGVCFGGGRRN